MNGSGEMQTGWQFINGAWYYMSSSGAMQIGWQQINGTWYYMSVSGEMQTGWRLLGSAWYYMNGSGAMQTGWQFINGAWYYMTGSGAMSTGWLELGENTYYLCDSGEMLTGVHYIDDTQYYFESDGRLGERTENVIDQFRSYVYVPYVHGGTSEYGWDCSGFTQWVHRQLGVSIPRTAAEQYRGGTYIDINDMSSWRPGDILCFSNGSRVGHVGLYLGDGQMMHALNERYGTYITGVWEYDRWDHGNSLCGVRRYL